MGEILLHQLNFKVQGYYFFIWLLWTTVRHLLLVYGALGLLSRFDCKAKGECLSSDMYLYILICASLWYVLRRYFTHTSLPKLLGKWLGNWAKGFADKMAFVLKRNNICIGFPYFTYEFYNGRISNCYRRVFISVDKY